MLVKGIKIFLKKVKKDQYCCMRHKNHSGYEIQRLVECRKKYYEIQKFFMQ